MIPKSACVTMSLGKLYKSTAPETSFPPILREVWEFYSFRKPQWVVLMQSPIWELSHPIETSSAI